jgi:hypothetical protein
MLNREVKQKIIDLLEGGLKQCSKCRQVISSKGFSKSSYDHVTGLSSQCKRCHTGRGLKTRLHKQSEIVRLFEKGLKGCASCLETLPVDQFKKDMGNGTTRLESSCRVCTSSRKMKGFRVPYPKL